MDLKKEQLQMALKKKELLSLEGKEKEVQNESEKTSLEVRKKRERGDFCLLTEYDLYLSMLDEKKEGLLLEKTEAQRENECHRIKLLEMQKSKKLIENLRKKRVAAWKKESNKKI